jgi:hypothetical protein
VTGFTGVVWQARPAQQLAADLVEGAGPTASADAGLAWGQVAVVLADAGIDYAAILARLGTGWESATSDQAFGKLGAFASWFADVSVAAADNGGRAAAQCAATTVARLNMPNLPEIALTERIRDTAAAVGTALGAPIGGVAADAERALHDQKQRAARVMEAYESATEPLAAPWFSPRPTAVVSDKALANEQLARDTLRTPGPSTPAPAAPVSTGAPIGTGFAPGAAALQPEKTRFAATVLAGSTAPPTAPATSGQSPTPRPSPPLSPVPPMVAPVAAVGAEQIRTPRATPTAGVDAGPAHDSNHWDLHRDGVADDQIDVRYRTGALDLPPATSVPAVLGFADRDR